MSLNYVLNGKEIVLHNPDPSDAATVISSEQPMTLKVHGNEVLSLNDTDNEVSMANNFYAKEFGGGTHVEVGNAAAPGYSLLMEDTGYLIIDAPGAGNCTQLRQNGSTKLFVCENEVKTDSSVELQVLNTTNATSAGSGCCILSGGLGAAGDIYSGYGHIKTVLTDQLQISTTDRAINETYAMRLVDSDGNYYNVPTGYAHHFRVNNASTALMTIAAAQIDVTADIDFNGNDHIGESDERLKENVSKSTKDHLAIVNACAVHTFNFKKDYVNNPTEKLGIMAQHLQQADASLVKTIRKQPICCCSGNRKCDQDDCKCRDATVAGVCGCKQDLVIDDCLVIEQQKLIFTMWGAIQQLSARIAALE